jgi:uncharacterized protein with FMN-binding domain
LLVVAGVVVTLATWCTGYVRTATVRDAPGARPTRGGVYRDGTYTAWGDSRHGRILATVVIRRGRISAAEITTCRMRYPCSMIAMLPGQVVTRQGTDVDLVSGATQSAEAFSMAVDRALEQATRNR